MVTIRYALRAWGGETPPHRQGVNTIEGKGLVKRHPPVNLTDRGMGPMRPRWIDLTVGVRFFSDTPLRNFRRPTHHRHPCKSFVERVAMAEAVAERLKGRHGGDRKNQGGNISTLIDDAGKTRDLAAAKAGLGSGKRLVGVLRCDVVQRAHQVKRYSRRILDRGGMRARASAVFRPL